MPAPIIDVILQEEIKKTTRDDPTVTLVSCDGEEILVHRQKMKKLIYFDKKITDKLRKLKLANTSKEIKQVIKHIYFNHKLSSKLNLFFNTNKGVDDIVLGDAFSDILLVSDDQKKFKAHKTLLRTRSKFFSKNLKDDQFYQVPFNEKDTKKMLEIIYSVKVPTKEEEVKFKKFLKPAFFKCKECPKSDFKTNRDLNKHINQIHGEPHKCDHCEVFMHLENLKRHIKTQHSRAPLTCYYCNKRFSTRELLIEHLLKVHKGHGQQLCEECFKFQRAKNFNRHFQGKHRGLTFNCNIGACTKQFKAKTALQRHQEKKRDSFEHNC